MKQLLSILIVVCSLSTNAQAPNSFKYQAIARNASGEVMADEQLNITIKIIEGSIDGPAIYMETHTDTSNAFGLFSIDIGSGNTANDFGSIDWANNSYFFEVSVNGQFMGINQLLSVPYALHANTANEEDPVFGSSVAKDITSEDVSNWNDANLWGNHAEAGYISDPDDADADPANEIQIISISNDTIYLSDGGFVKLPEGFSGSFTDLSDVPTNLDVNSLDDFDGNYNSLSNKPDLSNIANWNTAYGWGDHASEGYISTTAADAKYADKSSLDAPDGDPVDAIAVDNNGNVEVLQSLSVGYATYSSKLRVNDDGLLIDGIIQLTGTAGTSGNVTAISLPIYAYRYRVLAIQFIRPLSGYTYYYGVGYTNTGGTVGSYSYYRPSPFTNYLYVTYPDMMRGLNFRVILLVSAQ